MKKIAFILTAAMLSACGGRSTKAVAPVEDSAAVEVVEVADTPATEVMIDRVALRNKAASELKSWGAKDAYIDKDGYLVYEAYSSDISASPNDVAFEYYQMFCNSTIEGVRIVNHATKEEMGRYPKKQ